MGCIGPSIVVLQFGSLYKSSRYDVAITLHNLQVPGRDFQSQFQMDKPSANCLHRHARSRPHPPPPPGRLNFIFLSHSGIKRNQMKVAGSFFFFNHLPFSLWKQQKKSEKRICLGGKQTKDFGSEWKYVLMSLHVRIHFTTCALLSTYLLPRSPFFPIFTSKHQKSILNSMFHPFSPSQFSPKGINEKNLTL